MWVDWGCHSLKGVEEENPVTSGEGFKMRSYPERDEKEKGKSSYIRGVEKEIRLDPGSGKENPVRSGEWRRKFG